MESASFVFGSRGPWCRVYPNPGPYTRVTRTLVQGAGASVGILRSPCSALCAFVLHETLLSSAFWLHALASSSTAEDISKKTTRSPPYYRPGLRRGLPHAPAANRNLILWAYVPAKAVALLDKAVACAVVRRRADERVTWYPPSQWGPSCANFHVERHLSVPCPSWASSPRSPFAPYLRYYASGTAVEQNMAHIRQSRPDSGLGFQEKARKTF